MTPRRSNPLARNLLVAFLGGLLCSAFFACAPEREPLEMETVELGAGPTDQLTAEDDVVESAAGVSGLSLPADFPADLPVPPSASITSSSRGRTTFGTEDAADRAQAQLERELQRLGWSDEGDGRFTRSGVTVRIRFEPQDDRTLVVYRY